MPSCLECRHEKPPFTTCFECETATMRAAMEGAMRTCETCNYEYDSSAYCKCRKHGPGMILREPALASQLAAKDAIIKGLVNACKAAFEYSCDGCKRYGQTSCSGLDQYSEENCRGTRVPNALRAAIAAAREEGCKS